MSVCSKAKKHAQNLLLVSVDVCVSQGKEACSELVAGFSGCLCVARQTSMFRTCCWLQWCLYDRFSVAVCE